MKFWEPLRIFSWKELCTLVNTTYPVQAFNKKKDQVYVYLKSKEYLALVENSKYYGIQAGKYSSMVGSCGCSLWLFYQVQDTLSRIRQIVRTDALDLDFRRSEYIYLNDADHIKDVMGIQLIDLKGNLHPCESPSIPVQLWENYQKSKPWRWLNLAQSESWSGRQRGVRELAAMHDLEDCDYQQLAQAIDVRTAVGLARTPNVNQRLFLPPRVPSHSVGGLNEQLKTLLQKLNENIRHSCVDYILCTAFADYNDEKGTDLYAYWLETLQIPYHLRWISPHDLVQMSLRSLVHHGSLDDYPDCK
uniref:Protein SERAC1 n=1 Tax=Cacopsylla melanoneura TaxID=428564 RepID=A0A8D8YD47_9HEMI